MRYVITDVDYKHVKEDFVIDTDYLNIEQLREYLLKNSNLKSKKLSDYAKIDASTCFRTYYHFVRIDEDSEKLVLMGRMLFYKNQYNYDHDWVDFKMKSIDIIIPEKKIVE